MRKKLAVLLAALMLMTSTPGALAVERSGTPAQTQSAPYPGGINVSLNGAYLAFDGVAPITVDGRVMVPLRAFLETFGATVEYRSGLVTTVLSDGGRLTLPVHGTELNITRDGRTETVDLGAAPYSLAGSIYVPARPVGEALGLDVLWDGVDKVVYLTDWDAVREEIDQNFTHYNRLMAASLAAAKSAYDVTKPLAGKVNLSLSASADAPEGKGKGDAALYIDTLMDQSGLSVQMTPKLNLKELADLLFQDGSASALLAAVDGCDIQLIVDQSTGEGYLKTGLAARLGLADADGEVWYHIPGAGSYGGQDTGLVSGAQETMGAVLIAYQQSLRDTASHLGKGGGSPYQQVMALSALAQVFFGDDIVAVKESGSTATYQVELDTLRLGARLLRTGLVDEGDIKELLDGGPAPDLNFEMTATVRSGKLTAMEMELTAKTGGATPVDLTMTATGDAQKMALTMELQAQDGDTTAKLSAKMDVEVSQSSKAAPFAPPQGAKILELE